MKKILLVLVFCFSLFAQNYTDKDVEVCKSKFQLAVDKNLSGQPIGKIIGQVGRSFIGTEYVANTNELPGEEKLTINLTGLDCTTFLENALTFGRCIKKGTATFEDYQKELTLIRYRNGLIDKYPSRLHYTSDWIHDNVQKGIVEDITKSLGGKEIKFQLNFMSTHPNSYKQLSENKEYAAAMAEYENEINKRTYYYIPLDEIAKAEDKIIEGDLIAITTNIKGLDVGHVGIAVKENGKTHFMHAPITGSKVQITKDPLSVYVNKIKKNTGIIVLRPVEVK